MKQKHILNIGYPRTGTSWLWQSLTKQPWFSPGPGKENPNLIYNSKTVKQYVLDYNDYEITANFQTSMYAIDRYIISQLAEIRSLSVSIILRNPYDLYWSLYNFLLVQDKKCKDKSFNDSTRALIEERWASQFDQILTRWLRVFPKDRFEIFFYDDICSDSELFFIDYCKRMKLPNPVVPSLPDIVNENLYQDTDSNWLDVDIKNIINNNIDSLQGLILRDISHWKK